MIIHEFEKQVEAFGEKPAVITEDRRLTYRELDNYANGVGKAIRLHDNRPKKTQPHQVVGLLFRHGAGMIAAVLGTLKADKIYVPLDIAYPGNRLAYMLEHSQAYLLLTDTVNLPLAKKLAEKVNREIPIIDIETIDNTVAYPPLQRTPSGDKPAYILYTSGSTGKPKGVLQNHGNVCYYIRNWTERFAITAADRMTLFSAFSHDGAGQDMFGALHNGAVLYPYNILSRPNIAGLSQWLTRERITIWHSVPTLYRYFVETLKDRDISQQQFPDLRFILLGGEPLREHDIEMFKRYFPRARFANVYGQTESSVNSTWIIDPGETVNKMLIGDPLDKTQLLIVDREGTIVEDMGVGEIVVACPHLALGYWNDKANTEKVFFHDPEMGPLYRTGDLGRLLVNGNIEIMGREDTQVKIRGFRIEAGEVETTLLGHPLIKEAVVTVRTDNQGTGHLYGYYVKKTLPGTGEKETLLTVSEIRKYLSGELPEHMIPSYFVELEQMPLTPNGKIDRQRLPEPGAARPQLGVTYVAPKTHIEKEVSAIWREILQLDKVGLDDNFFDLGGTSFDILRITGKVYETYKREIPVISVFRYPTLRAFVEYLSRDTGGGEENRETGPASPREEKTPPESRGIAVIGMACRFPGAKNPREFWENLKNGVESIGFFSDRELREESGLNPGTLDNPSFIKARGIIDEIDYFDAGFFNYTPAEAEVMDPQLRILHELCWETLENAGYDPGTYEGLIGLYAGNAPNHHWMMLTWLSRKSMVDTGFLLSNYSTVVSYRLNLRGPSFILQCACSTSLVAVHLACRGIKEGESQMALAGGVSVWIPNKGGYVYQEGMIYSRDGHCRAFSDMATGTVFGNGGGMVLLKSLEAARADGDQVLAVVKGSGINNDGNRKVGLTAPSIEGQVEIISKVFRETGIDPESIGYVEAHGTGTVLGDPMELEALTSAFNTQKRQYCRIGSVKTNIGHLNIASGVAGFIKAVLTLKHRMIPPNLHFETPNSRFDFAGSPFQVNTRLIPWEDTGTPRRVGISSLGIGGTNAHIILEEAPGRVPATPGQGLMMLLLSANTKAALQKATENLAGYLEENPDLNLADVAYTLQVGRKPCKQRRMILCKGREEAIRLLTAADDAPGPEQGKMNRTVVEGSTRPVVFMLPGQGAQYVDMGRELYQREPVFREEMDRCFEILKPLLGLDIKEVIYPSDMSAPSDPSNRSDKSDSSDIHRTEITQPLLFVFEYALARLLMKWGIKPYALIGHSIGEYVAAALSGVFSLGDALKIVSIRGKLMQQMPAGSMVSVPLPEEELKPVLARLNARQDAGGELSLAAVNTTAYCVVSGARESVEVLRAELSQTGRECKRLHTSHAFHSVMMEPLLKEFSGKAKEISYYPPTLPYISNITGRWITVEDSTNPGYWTRHLRETVRFADGLEELLKEANTIFLEVGPGRSLSTFVQQHKDKKATHLNFNLVRHPREEVSDSHYLMSRIGRIWLNGVKIHWRELYAGQGRQRVPLPTYPFERRSYWPDVNFDHVDPRGLAGEPGMTKQPNLADWFYVPSWRTRTTATREIGGPSVTAIKAVGPSDWLVFMDECGIGTRLAEELTRQGHYVITVTPGAGMKKTGDNAYTVNPGRGSDYEALLREYHTRGKKPTRILHLWNVTGDKKEPDHHRALELGYYSLMYLAQAIGKQDWEETLQISVFTDHLQAVTGRERLEPQKAPLLGVVQVIPLEYSNLTCRCIDIEIPPPGEDSQRLLRQLMMELLPGTGDPIIAFRDNYRWVREYDPYPLEAPGIGVPRLKPEGVYLVTGGLGGVGLVLAETLATAVKARLILIGRTPLPPRQEWDNWMKGHEPQDGTSHKIREILRMEAAGAEVLVSSADVTDKSRMGHVINQARERFGNIDGVIHAAGVAGRGLIQHRTREMSQQVLNPKITGTLVLDELLKEEALDFFVLCSSISTAAPAIGQVSYCAANAFLDSYAYYKNLNCRTYTVSIDWDTWSGVGMAAEAAKKITGASSPSDASTAQSLKLAVDDPLPEENLLLKDAITPGEGSDVFRRVLGSSGRPQVAVSATNLSIRLQRHWERIKGRDLRKPGGRESGRTTTKHTRPELSTDYIAPKTETEKRLAPIWQDLLGLEQVGIDDDFFELGGDSLKAVNFSNRIHKELNAEIPISEFFNRPTIKELAEYIANSRMTRFSFINPVEKKQHYPLSPTQKRFFILNRLEEINVAYNLFGVTTLEIPLDIEKMQQVLQRIARRQESLRTSFHIIGGEPRQRVHGAIDFQIEYHEPGKDRSETEIIRKFSRPFDLSRAPLMRAGVIKLGEQKYIVLLDIHHIIFDGSSYAIFNREIMKFYNGEELLPLRIQYKEYVEWLEKRTARDNIRRQEAYWREIFSGEVPVLPLPLDYERPITQSFEGSVMYFVVEKEETGALKRVAKELETTTFMCLLAIINVLLMKLSSQEDIVVGTSVAGRTHADLESIMGVFINTLLLRNYPAPHKTFSAFLKEVKKHTLAAFENQEYPFEELVNKTRVARDLSRNPLFDVLFILNNEIQGGRHIEKQGKPESREYYYQKTTSQFDLSFICFEKGNWLSFGIEYCTRLFKKETIERWKDFFMRIFTAVVNDPGKKLEDIEIMSESEKNRLLYEFNNTGVEYPRHKTLHRLIDEQGQRTPDQVALTGPQQTHEKNDNMAHMPYMSYLSYKKLNEKAQQLARRIQEKGVGPGTIVGILAERSVDMMSGIVGILRAGGAYLPLDPGYPGERIRYMLKDSGAKLVVSDRNDLETGQCPIPMYNLTQQTTQTPPTHLTHHTHHTQLTQPTHQNLAYVIYTSGSTGKPKGVMVGHENAVNFIAGMTAVIDFSPGKAILAVTTVSFDIFFLETILPLTRGMRVVIAAEAEQKDPAMLERVLYRNCFEMVQLTPSRLQLLLDLKDDIPGLAGVRELMVGGEAFPPQLLQKVRERFQGKIHNMYGPTETTVWSAVKDLTHTEPNRITIGKPIANTQVYIVDGNMRLQPRGVVGELLIGGDGVARGYLNNPELTVEKFCLRQPETFLKKGFWTSKNFCLLIKSFCGGQGGGFLEKSPLAAGGTIYQTGDLARWLDQGEIEFLGRRDQQVKIRGFRVELSEIEEHLSKHEQIKEAVVVMKMNPPGEKYLCAYIVPVPGGPSTLETSELREWLSVKLPSYMIPAYFVVQEKMPLTPNGKVDRKALPDPKLSRTHLVPGNFMAPTTDNEKTIARIWKEILQVEEVGIHDNFFDMGGNSMNVILLNWKLKETFGKEIPIALMFRNLSIRFIDRYLAEGTGGEKIEKEVKRIEALERSRKTLKDTLDKLSGKS